MPLFVVASFIWDIVAPLAVVTSVSVISVASVLNQYDVASPSFGMDWCAGPIVIHCTASASMTDDACSASTNTTPGSAAALARFPPALAVPAI